MMLTLNDICIISSSAFERMMQNMLAGTAKLEADERKAAEKEQRDASFYIDSKIQTWPKAKDAPPA